MRKISLSFLCLTLVGVLACSEAFAFQAFQVKKIRILGLQRVSEAAVLNDISLQMGETLSESRSNEIIRALYKTGFFKEVTLERDGSVLVIHLVERPTVHSLVLTGIKDKDKVQKILREAGLAEGRLYDPTVLVRAQKELERHYLSKGRYGVRIDPTVTEDKSLVTVKLDIYEGDVARIKQIKIVGNTIFKEKELLKDFHSSTTNGFSWFTGDDQYVKEKLNADLETLRSYYMDRGYIHFQVESTEVSLTPDKKHIYITIYVTEGNKYHFGRVGIDGQFVVPEQKIKPLLASIKPGATFSRKTLVDVKQAIEERFGNEGYSLMEARPAVEVDERNKAVNVQFHVEPGHRVYVRRIQFVGNATTKDEVLRRELPQMEGTWISTGLIRDGKDKILRRGFGTSVEVETPEVPGHPEQVDVIYKIEEARLGQVGAGVAYSASEKLMFNFTLSQENFFGTGKGVDFTFDNSLAYTTYALGYQDPYFTIDGVGMGASAYYTKTDLSRTMHFSRYATDTIGGEFRWVFPMSKYDAIRTSLGYDDTRLKFDRNGFVAPEILNFTNKFGTRYQEWMAGVAWVYDSLDQRILPRRGFNQTLGVHVVLPGANQQYYKLNYEISWFYPISQSELWIVNLSSNLGYGDGYGKTSQMPFYRHFTAGGSRLIRGFEENTLGPKDSIGLPFGGNTLVAGSASLIFPTPFKPDSKSIRTALFLDAGQVYDTRYRKRIVNGLAVSRNPSGLRYSVGVAVTWHSPMGPLAFSLARPLNAKKGDDTRLFAFSVGTQF